MVCMCTDDGLVLSFADLPGNVAVQDSQFTSLPGFVIVSNSTLRFSNVTFSQCNTNGPGAYHPNVPSDLFVCILPIAVEKHISSTWML